MKTLDQQAAPAPKPNRKQQRRIEIDKKIAKLPTDDNGRPMVKAVKVGSTTVPIFTVINGDHWGFQVPFYPNGPGDRRLKTFADPDEAKLFASLVATGKSDALEILKGLTVERIGEVAEIAELLVPFCEKLGITLAAALKEYIAAKEIAGTQSLVEAMKDYLNQPWVTKSSMPLPEVIKEFLQAKRLRNCKPETLRKLFYVLNAFSRRIHGPPLGEVTKPQIEKEIHSSKRKGRSNYTYYCELHGFFAWARRNGYLRPDLPTAMDTVEAPLFDKKDPDVIPPAIALRILRILNDPECILYLVICMFCGGRADELISVQGRNVAPSEFLGIDAKDAKKREDKRIKILPLLDQWLRPWYGREGFWFSIESIQAKIVKCIKAYNDELKAKNSSEPPIEWKHNWLRHSYSAYRLHFTGDLIGTAEECDHDPATMARYYLVKVGVDKARQYFSITPEACGKADWEATVTAHLAQTPEVHKRITRKRKPKAGIDDVPEAPAGKPAAAAA